jgi:uncharacterized membrane protein
VVPAVDSRRRRRLPPFIYWPMTGPFLLIAIILAVALVALLQVGLVTYALGRLGISPEAAAIVLLACLVGGAVNIPVARLRGRAEVQLEPVISVFGMRYFVPVLRSRVTVIAVNLGGALIPAALSVYLIVHDHLGWWALLAAAIGGAGTFDGVFLAGIIAVLLASLL